MLYCNPQDQQQHKREHEIRPQRVKDALRWLWENNEHYHANMRFDDSWCAGSLNGTADGVSNFDVVPNLEVELDSEILNLPDVFGTFTGAVPRNDTISFINLMPLPTKLQTQEAKEICLELGSFPDSPTWKLPLSLAFPCLFPYGRGDLPPKGHEMDYYKKLLFYHDLRFMAEPEFIFFLFSTQMRRRASSVITQASKIGGSDPQQSLLDAITKKWAPSINSSQHLFRLEVECPTLSFI